MRKLSSMKMKSYKAILVALAVLAIPCSGYARQSIMPVDAGQLLHELEPERHVLPDPKVPDVKLDIEQPAPAVSEAKVFVKSINFNWLEDEKLANMKDTDCHAVFANEKEHLSIKSHKLVDGRLGKELTFKELVGIAEEASNQLRDLGYPTALVYMPRQNMQNGELKMNVMLGTYGDIVLTNNSMLTDKRNAGFMAAVKPGDLIYNPALNRRLLIMNELAGVQARANLAPGEKPGTAKLIVESDCLEKQGAAVYVDNHGSKATGRYRLGASYHYNNLNKTGDQLQANYMISNKKGMHNYSFQYESPFDREGSKARVAFSRMTYDFTGKSGLKSVGNANTFEVGVTQPMERELKRSNFIDYTYRHRSITDSLASNEFKKYTDYGEISLKGYTRRMKDMFSYELGYGIGRLGAKSELVRSTMNTNMYGHDILDQWYEKVNANFYYVHNFSKVTSVHISGSAQHSLSTNLDSSEQMFIGGPYAVRAFDSGRANGDCGALGTVEFRYKTDIEGLQLTAFYDVGYVRFNRYRYDFTNSNSETLAGAGIGLIYQNSRKWYAKVDYAIPLSSRGSEPNKAANHRLWFRVVKQI